MQMFRQLCLIVAFSPRQEAINKLSFKFKRSAERDNVGAIIHGSGNTVAKQAVVLDTPQGRKFTRDYGHQQIWW